MDEKDIVFPHAYDGDYIYLTELNAGTIFDQGEVQQLRAILKKQIADLEYQACEARLFAQQYKKVNAAQELIDAEWKEYYKMRAKIKKLAKLQVKMKMVDYLC